MLRDRPRKPELASRRVGRPDLLQTDTRHALTQRKSRHRRVSCFEQVTRVPDADRGFAICGIALIAYAGKCS